jgi:hypothetical protein
MAETANISLIANTIAHDIFKEFHWQVCGQHDTNFECVMDHHVTEAGKKKLTHPEDVIFHYVDPYLDTRIYLHTDLKSYSKSSIQAKKVREALHSLAWTVECAQVSPSWKQKYLTDQAERYEVRGLLMVFNHDGKAQHRFSQIMNGIGKSNIPVAESQTLHVLSPEKLTDLYAVASDIKLQVHDKKVGAAYRFVYPDQTLWKRRITDDKRVGATIELLTSPYFILRHEGTRDDKGEAIAQRGSVVYYARNGDTVEEFVYLLDSLLRYQLVNSKEEVRIRVFCRDPSNNLQPNFAKAKQAYCNEWGFHEDREQEIDAIKLERINRLSPNYTADEIGWRENR